MTIKKIQFYSKLVVFLLVFLGFFTLTPSQVRAGACSDQNIVVLSGIDQVVPQNASEFSVSVDGSYLDNGSYNIAVYDNNTFATWAFGWLPLIGDGLLPQSVSQSVQKTTSNTTLNFKLVGRGITSNDWIGKKDTKHVYLYRDGNPKSICKLGTFDTLDENWINRDLTCSALEIYQNRTVELTPDEGGTTTAKCYSSGCLDNDSPIYITGGEFRAKGVLMSGERQRITLKCAESGSGVCVDDHNVMPTNGSINFQRVFDTGNYRIIPQSQILGFNFQGLCQSSSTFTVVDKCPATDCNRTNITPTNETPFKLCDQISDKKLRRSCQSCAGGDDQDAAGIWTAVGCIKREPTALISALIQIGLSIAGGITLLVILAAGFMLTTSQGDPKRAGEAKEMITAAVMGILFIIFSVTILQFIGYNVLKIPGFGG